MIAGILTLSRAMNILELSNIFPQYSFLPADVQKAIIKSEDLSDIEAFAAIKRQHIGSHYFHIAALDHDLSLEEAAEVLTQFQGGTKPACSYRIEASFIEHILLAELKTDNAPLSTEYVTKVINSPFYQAIVQAYHDLYDLNYRLQGCDESNPLFIGLMDHLHAEIEQQLNQITQLKHDFLCSDINNDYHIQYKRAYLETFVHGSGITVADIAKHASSYHNFRRQLITKFLQQFRQKCHPLCLKLLPGIESAMMALAKAKADALFKNDELIYATAKEKFLADINKAIEQNLKRAKNIVESTVNVSPSQNPLAGLFMGIVGKVDNVAEAYGFLQYAGFGSQSDFLGSSIFDTYNATRNASRYSFVKQIILGLLEPFKPLLKEYQSIGLYETNSLRKVVRAIIPLLIVISTAIAIAALLAPLGLPEVAFMAAAIPSMMIGLVLATTYCLVKDSLYHNLRCLIYFGEYNIPEFQVNHRMKSLFTNPEIIRKVYIEQIHQAKSLENYFAHRPSLTDLEIQQRSDNQHELQLLLTEWYDVHENIASSKEATLAVVSNRIARVSSKIAFQVIQKTKLNESDYVAVKDAVNAYGNDVIAESGHNSTTQQQRPLQKLSMFWQRHEEVERTQRSLHIAVCA